MRIGPVVIALLLHKFNITYIYIIRPAWSIYEVALADAHTHSQIAEINNMNVKKKNKKYLLMKNT